MSEVPSWMSYFDTEDLVKSSADYYLGRTSANVEFFCRDLCRAWTLLPEHVQRYIRMIVEEAFSRDDRLRSSGRAEHLPLGHDCDRRSWERVRALWSESGKDTDERSGNHDNND